MEDVDSVGDWFKSTEAHSTRVLGNVCRTSCGGVFRDSRYSRVCASGCPMLILDHKQDEHVKRLEAFQRKLSAKAGGDQCQGIRRRPLLRKLTMAGRGLRDYCWLLVLAMGRRRVTNVVFVTRGLVLYERFFSKLDLESAVFINYHQTHLVESFAGSRVFNVGVFVGALKRVRLGGTSLLRDVRLFGLVYLPIHRLLKGSKVYFPCYYDANGLALVFNDRRGDYELVEIQHGGICNFEPYSRPVSFRVADRIMVLDARTAAYLKNHLYKKADVNIEIIESGEARFTPRIDNEIPVILYCSTIEINGIHEKFLRFLNSCDMIASFNLRVRLHPREGDRKERFRRQLEELGVDFEFDDSSDWLAGNPFRRLIVVTPWSSVIEEAHREGIFSVILDDFGKQRFQDLIDGKLCWFAEEPRVTFREVFERLDDTMQAEEKEI